MQEHRGKCVECLKGRRRSIEPNWHSKASRPHVRISKETSNSATTCLLIPTSISATTPLSLKLLKGFKNNGGNPARESKSLLPPPSSPRTLLDHPSAYHPLHPITPQLQTHRHHLITSPSLPPSFTFEPSTTPKVVIAQRNRRLHTFRYIPPYRRTPHPKFQCWSNSRRTCV